MTHTIYCTMENPIKSVLALSLWLVLSSYVLLQNIDWIIDENYSIKFTSDNPSGVFKSLSGTISFDPENIAGSQIHLLVDVNSINTGNGMKNKHALSEEWFDAAQYPTIEFTSSSFEKHGQEFLVRGTMTMHGISKEMSIPFNFHDDTFRSSFKIDRTDFKIGSTRGMSGKAATELVVDVNVPVTKK